MWPNPQETVDLAIFTKEILNEILHFLCSGVFLLTHYRLMFQKGLKSVKKTNGQWKICHFSEWNRNYAGFWKIINGPMLTQGFFSDWMHAWSFCQDWSYPENRVDFLWILSLKQTCIFSNVSSQRSEPYCLFMSNPLIRARLFHKHQQCNF